MRVMLRRDLFLGGVRYRQTNRGTEIPEVLVENGIKKKVVFWEKGMDPDDPTIIPLPADAVPYSPGMKVPARTGRNLLWNAGQTRAVALSELARPLEAQAEALTKAVRSEESDKAKESAQRRARAEAYGVDAKGAPKMPSKEDLGHPALAPSPDQPTVADQTGEKPPTALPPAIKPGADSEMADAKAGEGQPDPRTPAAIKAGKGIKPEDLPKSSPEPAERSVEAERATPARPAIPPRSK